MMQFNHNNINNNHNVMTINNHNHIDSYAYVQQQPHSQGLMHSHTGAFPIAIAQQQTNEFVSYHPTIDHNQYHYGQTIESQTLIPDPMYQNTVFNHCENENVATFNYNALNNTAVVMPPHLSTDLHCQNTINNTAAAAVHVNQVADLTVIQTNLNTPSLTAMDVLGLANESILYGFREPCSFGWRIEFNELVFILSANMNIVLNCSYKHHSKLHPNLPNTELIPSNIDKIFGQMDIDCIVDEIEESMMNSPKMNRNHHKNQQQKAIKTITIPTIATDNVSVTSSPEILNRSPETALIPAVDPQYSPSRSTSGHSDDRNANTYYTSLRKNSSIKSLVLDVPHSVCDDTNHTKLKQTRIANYNPNPKREYHTIYMKPIVERMKAVMYIENGSSRSNNTEYASVDSDYIIDIVDSAIKFGAKRQISKRTFEFKWKCYTVIMSKSLKTILDVTKSNDIDVITVHPDVVSIINKKCVHLDYFTIQKLANCAKLNCNFTTKKNDYRQQFIYEYAQCRIVFASNHTTIVEMQCHETNALKMKDIISNCLGSCNF